MILQELVLQPILEFIVDKFAEELLKEDEEGNGGFSNVDNLANQGQNTQQVSALSDGSGLKTPCVGSYPVSGYTRSDGTEVKPYTRTCGAKHLSQENEKRVNNNAIDNGFNTPFELKVEHNQVLDENNQSHIKSRADKYQGLSIGQSIQKAISKSPISTTEWMYYGLANKFADNEEPGIIAKLENDIYKLNNITDKEQRRIYINKVAQMYKLDTNDVNTYKIIDNMDIDIVMPKVNSDLYNLIKNSKITQAWIAKNYEKLQNGTYKDTNDEKSTIYPLTLDLDGLHLFATIHNTDIENFKINPDGSVILTINDGYNFEELSKKEYSSNNPLQLLKIALYNGIVDINNQAFITQQQNQLKPYILTTQLYYTKEEIDKLLRKYKK